MLNLTFGWIRDLPDVRDYTDETASVKSVLASSRPLQASIAKLPVQMDLRTFCSPVEDQGPLGSCTACAGVGLMEYFERKAYNKYVNASRLFLYKTTRNILGWTGDQGAYLRNTMQSMVLFGLPPESSWPYNISSFDAEPTAFAYAYASNYKTTRYYRLDPPGTPTSGLLGNIKTKLAANLPIMFGFTVYSSIYSTGNGNGDIPYPRAGERVLGGHAVVAIGFNDAKVIDGHKGALLIRNSWSTSWGERGYGWLPYDYVLNGLAVDFWSLVQANFVDTDIFR